MTEGAIPVVWYMWRRFIHITTENSKSYRLFISFLQIVYLHRNEVPFLCYSTVPSRLANCNHRSAERCYTYSTIRKICCDKKGLSQSLAKSF